MFLAMLIMVASFLNISWLTCVRSEARRHAESAAIVGGHAFLSDDLLRPRQQPFEHEGRSVRCRAAAVDYVRHTGNSSVVPAISQDDVELIPGDAPATNQHSSTPLPVVPREIRVSFGKHQSNDQLRMFFSSLTGVRNAKIGVTAIARIEHAPVGFQPGKNLTIPVFPLGIIDQIQIDTPPRNTAGIWSEQVESGKGSDNLSWNPEQRTVQFGPDGLPEVTLTLTPDTCGAGPEGLVPLMFTATASNDESSRNVRWMKYGVAAEDLETLGRSSLSFPSTIPTSGLSKRECGEIADYLKDQTGQPFIICLCDPITASSSSKTQMSNFGALSTVQLNRPVAARIMAVGMTPDGSVKIQLQPCVLITSTAIMSPSSPAAHNRYIYSVGLCN